MENVNLTKPKLTLKENSMIIANSEIQFIETRGFYYF